MSRRPKIDAAPPEEQEPQVGQAEAQRLAKRAEALQQVEQAEQALAEAQATLEQSKQMYAVGASATSFAKLLEAPRAEVELAEIRLSQARSKLAVYDSPVCLALVQQWDAAYPDPELSASGQFEIAIEPEAEIVREAALALVSAVASMQEKLSRIRNATSNHDHLVRQLRDYGIRVRFNEPKEWSIQSTVARALKVALAKFNISAGSQFVRECLSPHEYDMPANHLQVKSAKAGEKVKYTEPDRSAYEPSVLSPRRNVEAEKAAS